MTGQIVPKDLGTVDNNRKACFKLFFFSVLDSLSNLGYPEMRSSISQISPEEINWAINYLNKYNQKLKREGYNPRVRSYFLTTKAIAIMALWHGYIKSGGVSPPPLEKPFSIGIIDQKHTSKSIKPRGVAVIPTRITEKNFRFSNILNNILPVLVQSNLISKILLIGEFDEKLCKILERANKVACIELSDDKGPSHARNIGIDVSLSLGSDFIIFMDDDVVINKKSEIEQLAILAYNCNGIVAPLIKSLNKTWFDIYHEYDGTLNGVYLQNNSSMLLYATTCFVAISNKIFEAGLKFDEDFRLAAGEDIDLSLRALKNGFPIVGADDIIIYHDYGYTSTDGDLDKFISRYIRYGKGNSTLLKKHPYYYTLLSVTKERKIEVNLSDFKFISPKLFKIASKLKMEEIS